jgi:hypothetical protein
MNDDIGAMILGSKLAVKIETGLSLEGVCYYALLHGVRDNSDTSRPLNERCNKGVVPV